MVWQYNLHEDFVPYYDEHVCKWAVSIQYLDVWFYKTEEEAIADIPRLKQYRLKILKEVDRQNKEYYRSLRTAEHKLKKDLADYRKHEDKITTRTIKQLSAEEKHLLRRLIENDATEEYIKLRINVNSGTIGQLRMRKKEREKQCTKNITHLPK